MRGSVVVAYEAHNLVALVQIQAPQHCVIFEPTL